MWRKGNPLTLLVGLQAGIATLEDSMEIPQKVKNRATLQPRNCTTRYLPKGYKHSNPKGYLHPNVYRSNGDPRVAQRFSACLWPRARSWRAGIESHIGLPVHGACFSLII